MRQFKFQIKKKERKKQSYINWVASPWGKAVYALLGKDSFVQLSLVILKKMKEIILHKQYFAFHIGTVCHVWNSIFQPLALVASTRTTILAILSRDYEE